MNNISVVFNTFNQEKNLPNALKSIQNLAGEVVVADMGSTDDTVNIAKKFGAKVYESKFKEYVEPVRNFAIEKATSNWVLVLDADEELPKTLIDKLREISTEKESADYYRIPRKNMIFGKWIKHTFWWPDYNIRFFKKGFVSWNEIIHSVPFTKGRGFDLEPLEKYAITHWHYTNLAQYIERMNRYTTVQSKILSDRNVKFSWTDIVTKPNSEFMRRYFSEEGYKDGIYGLALSSLQSFSELVLYLKLWETEKFSDSNVDLKKFEKVKKVEVKENMWWIYNIMAISSKNPFCRIWLKIVKNLKYR